MKKASILAILLSTSFGVSMAQEKANNGYNPLSLHPVHESNVMYKTTLWSRLDLHEKQNQPLFARNAEITKHLIEAVKAGLLDAYKDDSVMTKLTVDQFNQRLKIPLDNGGGLTQAEKDAGFKENAAAQADDGWGGGGGGTTTAPKADDGWGNSSASVAEQLSSVEFFPQDLSVIELKEDLVFDKQHSRQVYDIHSLTIIIPADKNPAGFEKVLASFRYKDLDRYFRSNPKCIWYNSYNIAQHKNLADAFELRLFHRRIVKSSNPRDEYLDIVYKTAKDGLIQSQRLEHELMEKEHNLWEY